MSLITLVNRTAAGTISAAMIARLGRSIRVADLYRWRKAPGPLARRSIPPSLLRHADEQTLAALWVLQQAFPEEGIDDLESWGVVVGTHLFGRAGQSQATQRFLTEGAWGISPHLIPHHSLHAPSGTISLVLGARGPNFGVANGADLVSATFLAAGSLLQGTDVPGLWVLLTRFASNFVPTPAQPGPGDEEPIDVLALALRPLAIATSLDDATPLTWHMDLSCDPGQPVDLETLTAFLTMRGGLGRCCLGNGLVLERTSARRLAA